MAPPNQRTERATVPDVESARLKQEDDDVDRKSTPDNFNKMNGAGSSVAERRNLNADLRIEVPQVPSPALSPSLISKGIARRVDGASPAMSATLPSLGELPRIQRKGDDSARLRSPQSQPSESSVRDTPSPASISDKPSSESSQSQLVQAAAKNVETDTTADEKALFTDKFKTKDDIVLGIEDIDVALHKVSSRIEEFKKNTRIANKAAAALKAAAAKATDSANELDASHGGESMAPALSSANFDTAYVSMACVDEIKFQSYAQQIYMENRIKAEQSTEVFDFLVTDDSVVDCLVGKDFAELDLIRECEKTAREFMPELERIIGEDVEREERKHWELASHYKKRMRRWMKSVAKKEAQIAKKKQQQDKKKKGKERKKGGPGGNRRRSIMDRGRDSQSDLIQESIVRERYRKTLAAIPPMVYHEDRRIIFENENGFIEDPLKEYNERRAVERAWTQEEKNTFMEKFAEFPKDLHKIAKYLPNKTVGDVVNFYYLNKRKSEFEKLIKELKQKRRFQRKIYDEGGSTRVTIIPAQDPDSGSPSIISRATPSSASSVDSSEVPRELRSLGVTADTYNATIETLESKESFRRPRSRSSASETAQPEVDFRGWSEADRSKFIELLRVYGKDFRTISKAFRNKKTVSQCRRFFNINKDALQLEELLPDNGNDAARVQARRQDRRSRSRVDSDMEVVGEIVQNDGTKKRDVSYWSKQERADFFNHLAALGRNWSRIAELLGTKTAAQVKCFFSHYKSLLGLRGTGATKDKSSKGRRASGRSDHRKRKAESSAEVVKRLFMVDPRQLDPSIFTPDLVNLSHICSDVADKGGASFDHMRPHLLNNLIITPRILRRLRRAGPSILYIEIIDSQGRKRRKVFRPIDPKYSRLAKHVGTPAEGDERDGEQCQDTEESNRSAISWVENISAINAYELEEEWSPESQFADIDSPSPLDNLEALSDDIGWHDVSSLFDDREEDGLGSDVQSTVESSRDLYADNNVLFSADNLGFAPVDIDDLHQFHHIPMPFTVGHPGGFVPAGLNYPVFWGEHPSPVQPSSPATAVPRYFTSEPAVAFEKLQVLGDVADEQKDVPIQIDRDSSNDKETTDVDTGVSATSGGVHQLPPPHYFVYPPRPLIDPFIPFPSMPEFVKLYEQMQQGGAEGQAAREELNKLLAREGIPTSGPVVPGLVVPVNGVDPNAHHGGMGPALPSLMQMSEQIRTMEIYPQSGSSVGDAPQHVQHIAVNSVAHDGGSVIEQGTVLVSSDHGSGSTSER